jgi:hypothetical protein
VSCRGSEQEGDVVGRPPADHHETTASGNAPGASPRSTDLQVGRVARLARPGQIDVLNQKQKLASSKEEVEVRDAFRRAITAGTAKPAK